MYVGRTDRLNKNVLEFPNLDHSPPPCSLTALFGPGIMLVNYGASGTNTRCNFDPKIHARPCTIFNHTLSRSC